MLSIIVPYYSSDFLELYKFCARVPSTKCDIEFVFVCDGCCLDETFHFDFLYNFVLIKLEFNRGANFARAIGLSKATGSMVCFVDSDDTLLPGFFECRIRTPPGFVGVSGVKLLRGGLLEPCCEERFNLSIYKNLAGFYQFGLWACTMERDWAIKNLKFYNMPIFQDYYNINIVATQAKIYFTKTTDYIYHVNSTGISRQYKSTYRGVLETVMGQASELGATCLVKVLLRMNLYGKLLEIGAPRNVVSNFFIRILGLKARSLAHEFSKFLS